MVEHQDTRLDAVFHALGDATRRSMLRSLAQGERTVGQLADPCQMSLAAASKHVKVLEEAGLIRREIQGRTHICHLEAAPLAEANAWLRTYEQFWNARLDQLEHLLRQEAAAAQTVAKPSPRQRRASARAATPPARKAKRSTR